METKRALAGGGWLVLSTAAVLAQQTRPNIVFIMTDDHTAQMMSC